MIMHMQTMCACIQNLLWCVVLVFSGQRLHVGDGGPDMRCLHFGVLIIAWCSIGLIRAPTNSTMRPFGISQVWFCAVFRVYSLKMSSVNGKVSCVPHLDSDKEGV